MKFICLLLASIMLISMPSCVLYGLYKTNQETKPQQSR